MDHKIKTYEDACVALDRDPQVLPVVTGLPEKHALSIIAYYMLVTICEALNEGWEPNWNDEEEYKYQPWFKVDASADKPSGFGFSLTDCDFWISYAFVGSRLCLKSNGLALYAGKQFADLYKQYLLLP